MPARFADRCVNRHKNSCTGHTFIIDSLFVGQANKGNDVVLACPRQKLTENDQYEGMIKIKIIHNYHPLITLRCNKLLKNE